MGNSPAIYGGSRTKILTSKGLLLKDGTIDYNGQKNYITKGSFPTNATTGWNLKRTTLSNKVPNQVSASWTTPSVLTLTATSTGALTNAGYSLSLAASGVTTAGDMLVSDAYTLDVEDQAKALRFQFSYKAYTNPTNLNFSGTSSNTFHVYIYDETNSAWIQPSGCYTMVQGSGVGTAYGEFQTPSNMTSFRIAIVSCNASLSTVSGGAFTMYFDNFYVGPQYISMGPPVTDWQSFAPTGTWTTNATYTGKRRRIGDSEEYDILVSCSGTPTATTLFVTIPDRTFDTSKMTNFSEEPLGIGTMVDSGTQGYVGTVLYNNTNSVLITSYFTNSTHATYGGGYVSNTVPFAFGINDSVRLRFTVPITGWSSNTVMSSDAAVNVVSGAARRLNTNQTGVNPNASSVKIQLNAYNGYATDTNGSWDFVNYRYLVAVSGKYFIQGGVVVSSTNVLNSLYSLQVWKNGIAVTRLSQIVATASQSFCMTGTIEMDLKAGDYVELYLQGDGNNSVNTLTVEQSTVTRMGVTRISGPAQISAASVVVFQAVKGSLAPQISGTAYNFGTATIDTYGAWNGATTYTIPISGYYEIAAQLQFSVTASASQYYNLAPYINGAAGDVQTKRANGAAMVSDMFPYMPIIKYLNAGTTVSLANTGTNYSSITTSTDASWFSIKRIGGVM